MPTLEVLDTVVLKTQRHLVGVVARTSYEADALHDTLIIAHVPVEQSAITQFATTGTPPKGHIFVRFGDETHGSALVREDDVELLDRAYNLGDLVKKDDSNMLGSVISVNESYILQPIWIPDVSANFPRPPITVDRLDTRNSHTCDTDCPFGLLTDITCLHQNLLLHNIPAEELKKAHDVLEEDLVIQDDWVGVVDGIDQIVVVLLEDDSVVIVKEPEELYIPVPDSGKPLVSLPEFDHMMRPDPLVALQGWTTTMPPQFLRCGQMVITNPRNIRQGRWLRGQYNANIKPQGHILDVRTKSLEVRWLACNAYMPGSPSSVNWPSPHASPYENISTFPKRSELRSNKQLSVFDQHRVPRICENRLRKSSTTEPANSTVKCSSEFQVGDQVKFRDQAGAALKYQGKTSSNGQIHGRFNRIASAMTHGFDVNEFKIVTSHQESTVRWQDGTTSTHLSKNLTKFTLFELDLGPADLVVAREGMKQKLAPKWDLETQDFHVEHGVSDDFNEMKFFEQAYDLLPHRVGVVQNVDQQERVAQVRWFENPNICLTNFGQVLSSSSRFGQLSEAVEDVSLYEIMTFPALQRTLRDPVLIQPNVISIDSLAYWNEPRSTRQLRHTGSTVLSHIGATAAFQLLAWLQRTAFILTQDGPNPSVTEQQTYRLHPKNDWIGEIVAVGLDGIVTVRLNTRETCTDVNLEHDQLICIIDELAFGDAPLHDASSTDSEMDYSMDGSDFDDSISTISETVIYEGGERLDDDSGDDNWEDAPEDDEVMKDESTPLPSTGTVTPLHEFSGVKHEEKVVQDKIKTDIQEPSSTRNGHTSAKRAISSPSLVLPSEEPASFAILDEEPPENQYQDPTPIINFSPAFLKRVLKEHRILASSLPKGEIYVRTYENRLDLFRCLIIGPADTPYEYAPFLVDLQLGKNFPREPPHAHFHSWTSGLGRINPNLYEEGKICLSLLGTWPGKGENEGWSEKATILQILVSLQGLVFVRQPFYNEAGFEGHAEGGAYNLEAQRYNEKAYLMARGFVKHALASPVRGLEDVLAWSYLPHDDRAGLLNVVISRSHRLMKRSEESTSDELLLDGAGSSGDETRVFIKPLSRGATVLLKKTLQFLEQLLSEHHSAGKDSNVE